MRCLRRSAAPSGFALCVITGLALSSFSFNPDKAYSGDVTVIQDVSLVKPGIDSDGDGLPDSVETNTGVFVRDNFLDTGTDPLNPDTDEDLINDGIEVYQLGNPLNPDEPGTGTGSITRSFSSIQNLTASNPGDFTLPRTSAWLPTGQVFYFETDGITNTVYEKDLYNLGKPREALFTGIENTSTIAVDPLGIFIYFHRNVSGTNKVFKFNRKLKQAPTEALLGVTDSVRWPALALDLMLDSGKISYDSFGAYLVGEAGGRIKGYKLNTNPLSINFGNWDLSPAIPITGTTFGFLIHPRVSPEGDNLMFAELRPGGKDRLWVWKGLKDIFRGVTQPFENIPSELRGSIIRTGDDGSGVTIPGGITKNHAYLARDKTNNYVLTNPFNFSGSDFDVEIASLGLAGGGRFGLTSPIRLLHIPGNQIYTTPSLEGGRIMFSDDYINNNGIFDLYVASVAPSMRIQKDTNPDTMNTFIHPSGLIVEGNNQGTIKFSSGITLPGGQLVNLFRIFTPLKPIGDAAKFDSFVTNIKSFAPRDLTIENGRLRMREPWTVYDLMMRDGIINPETLEKGIEINGTYYSLPSSVYERFVNPGGDGYFMLALDGFTTETLSQMAVSHGLDLKGVSINDNVQNFGMQGQLFPKLSSARRWQLYE